MHEESKILIPHYEIKGWGIENLLGHGERVGEVYAWHSDSDFEYKKHEDLRVKTVKVLYFGKDKRLSLHFHREKEEIFYCAYGNIEVVTISKDGKKSIDMMQPGDRIFIPRCMPHRMRGINDVNILVEVSTLHKDEDSYRIEKGD